MRFKPLYTSIQDKGVLKTDFKVGNRYGIAVAGNNFLFFKSFLTAYYIPYSEITRCFRRVLLVPAKMQGNSGNLQVESVAVYNKDGEVAAINMPGKKSAEEFICLMKLKAPDADFTPEGKGDSREK